MFEIWLSRRSAFSMFSISCLVVRVNVCWLFNLSGWLFTTSGLLALSTRSSSGVSTCHISIVLASSNMNRCAVSTDCSAASTHTQPLQRPLPLQLQHCGGMMKQATEGQAGYFCSYITWSSHGMAWLSQYFPKIFMDSTAKQLGIGSGCQEVLQ